jgi:hypothetical protein
MSRYQVSKAVNQLRKEESMQYPHRTKPVYDMSRQLHEVRKAAPIDVRMAPSARRKTVVLLVEFVLESCRNLPRSLLVRNTDEAAREGYSLPNSYLALRPNETLRNHYAKVVAEVLRPDVPKGASFDHGGSPVTELGTYYAMPAALTPDLTVRECASARVPCAPSGTWASRSSFHLLSDTDKRMVGQHAGEAAGSRFNAGSASDLYVKRQEATHPKAVTMHSTHAYGAAIANGTLHSSVRANGDFMLLPPHPAACIVAAQRSFCPRPKAYPNDFFVKSPGADEPSMPYGRGWRHNHGGAPPEQAYNLPDGFCVE